MSEKGAMEMFLSKKRKILKLFGYSSPPRKIIEREHNRINYKTAIRFQDYETKEIAHGEVHNYSGGGFHIETDYCPKVGIGALIYIDNYSPNALGPDSLKKYHVQVKWVKQIKIADNQNRYRIGVKRCSDIDELFRLFGH